MSATGDNAPPPTAGKVIALRSPEQRGARQARFEHIRELLEANPISEQERFLCWAGVYP